MKHLIIIAALLLLVGCSRSNIDTTPVPVNPIAHIKCYSGGGVVVYEGDSAGLINTTCSGFWWRDYKTGNTVEASGTCLFFYGYPR